VGLRETLQSHVESDRGPHQLMGDPQHRGN
jgi:hypothetical protein